MKITDVEAVVLRSHLVDGRVPVWSEDDLVILVQTDEGIVGIGEVDSAPEVVRAIVEAPRSQPMVNGLRELLLGENPLDIERLWSKMYRGVTYFGRRGAAIHAISGVDMALWDIKGKALSKPVCDLIGLPARQRVRAYATVDMPDSVSEVTDRVAELREMGFTAIKFSWGSLGKGPERDILRARAARDAGGSQVDILIDAGFGYASDTATAIRVARELEELGVFWLEEPFDPDDYESYARLADSVELK